MRISAPINQQYSKYNSPAFTSIYYKNNTYRDSHGIKRETQNSTCKRTDLDYKRLAEISKERFKDFDRVNIMPMNVSDGTESYFLGKSFIEANGRDVFESKYSPLHATDVCKDIIESYPQKFLVHLFKNEPEDLKVFGEPMFRPAGLLENFQEIIINRFEPLYKLDQKYQKYFTFGVMDFQERLAKMRDEGNSIVIIRNCLKQSFGDIKSAMIAYQLAEKLKGASLFVSGDYDRGMPLFESALDDNFVEIEHNIWARKDYKPETPDVPDLSKSFNGNPKRVRYKILKFFKHLKKHIK